MKKIILFFALSFIGLASHSQSTPSSMPGTLGKIADADDLFIVSITSDNWINLPSTIESKPFRSRGFSFLIMKEKMNAAGHVGIGYGLGFSSQNVHTDGVLIYNNNTERNYLEKISSTTDLETNKLSLNFIDAALEIRLRSTENSKKKSFKVNAGIKGGILVQSHTKFEDEFEKFKTYDIKGLNDFQYGVTGRIGYGNVALCVYYSLVDVFEKDKGPELTPFSAGISFTF